MTADDDADPVDLTQEDHLVGFTHDPRPRDALSFGDPVPHEPDDFQFNPPAAPKEPPLDISHLRDAVAGDGKPLFGVGDKIVIQRQTPPETLTYRVTSLDPATGNMWLYDEMNEQHAGGNWVTGPKSGDVIKMAPGRGVVASKRRRGFKAPKPAVVASKSPTVKLKKDGTPAKKRGRPKGSKNRPRAVRLAEKKSKAKTKSKKH